MKTLKNNAREGWSPEGSPSPLTNQQIGFPASEIPICIQLYAWFHKMCVPIQRGMSCNADHNSHLRRSDPRKPAKASGRNRIQCRCSFEFSSWYGRRDLRSSKTIAYLRGFVMAKCLSCQSSSHHRQATSRGLCTEWHHRPKWTNVYDPKYSKLGTRINCSISVPRWYIAQVFLCLLWALRVASGNPPPSISHTAANPL